MKWYVYYTTPRSEKKVKEELLLKGYEVFLPIEKKLKIWNNRQKKIIEEVLFPGYIFVNSSKYEVHNIIRTRHVATVISLGKDYCTVSDCVISNLKKMLQSDRNFTTKNELIQGQKVLIKEGLFKGVGGIVTELRGKKRLAINVEIVNKSVVFEMELDNASVENVV